MVDKKKEKISWSFFLLALTILVLVSVVSFCLYGLYGLSYMIHYQKMDELQLEKDIALINNQNDTKYIYHYDTYKINTSDRKPLSCVVKIHKWDGDSYQDVYEYMDKCYEVIK